MAKAGTKKKLAKPKLTDEEQSERLKETARRLSVDKSAEKNLLEESQLPRSFLLRNSYYKTRMID
jgi:hypothetical protein